MAPPCVIKVNLAQSFELVFFCLMCGIGFLPWWVATSASYAKASPPLTSIVEESPGIGLRAVRDDEPVRHRGTIPRVGIPIL